MRRFVLISFAMTVILVTLVTTISFHKTLRHLVPKASLRTFHKRPLHNKSTQFCTRVARRERIRWNYFYYYQNQKKSLLWCKIPKVGSTTFTKLLLRLAGANHILQKNTTKIHKTLRSFYPRATMRNYTKYLSASYKFIIVRHPFERILSAYRDKLESYTRDLKFRDGYYYENYGSLMKTSTHNTSRKEPTWQEFVNYLLKTPVSRFDEHWMPMTRLCSPCKVRYDAIIKLDNFTHDITRLLKNVGVSVSDSIVGLTHRTGSSNHSVITKYFGKLSTRDIKKLYLKFRNDFLVFGYSPLKYYKMSQLK